MNAKTRKPIKSGKSAQATTQAVEPIEPGATPEADQSNLARIHDLTSLAFITIPQELRGIIGDEAYERYAEELEQHEILLIVREPHDVVYIRVPIIALPIKPRGLAPQEAVKAPAHTKTKGKGKPSTKPVRKARGQD
jgi:hypothetical protein